KTFGDRLRGYPLQLAQASRLVSANELAKVKKGIAEGSVDIVIGTHALLGKNIKFKDLGLIVVDEEQHFGVAHKERLKQLRAEAKSFLDKHVPEVRVAVAHGQMPARVLEDVMSAFYEGKFDLLLSTTIVESGLDIPTANTLIVHRADMFGLAQIYQLRGRVGRSKLRAYALFTLPSQQKITAQAERRLTVLQSLETLGA